MIAHRSRAARLFPAILFLLLAACDSGATTPTSVAPTSSAAPPTAISSPTVESLPTVKIAGDRKIDRAALFHDSRDPYFREPGGAVPAGTEVTLRIRTAPLDLTEATVRLWDSRRGEELLVPMSPVTDDVWAAVIKTPAEATALWYRFQVSDGLVRAFYNDDEDLDGGTGQGNSFESDRDYALVAYDPAFEAPAWVSDGVVYQIFPDRFNNGDPSNDKPAGTFFYGGKTQSRAWGDKPTGGDDFFGGDLKGVIDKLDYLQSLGVTAIWFNPIFQAPSNHRYDTTDFTQIEPSLGTIETFRELVSEARKRGIRLILDGVFNHASSDSIYFDKFSRYDSEGAFESQQSPYYSWFRFKTWPAQYDSWSNIDTLPVFAENDAVRRFFFLGPDAIIKRWTQEGLGGWRLDAAEQKSHDYWRTARQAIKSADPDAVIIGEYWHNSAPWLAGDQWDGTMNYRFRDAVGGWLAGPLPNVEKMARKLDAIREAYPPQAVAASMNILDSHDTPRALTEARGDKNMLMMMALMQFTWPGMPTIYYGDEAGLEGNRDPDDRRTYPWGSEDKTLIEFYRLLAATRKEWSALRTGDYLTVGFDRKLDYYAFARRDDDGSALVVVNRSGAELDLELNVKDILADGLTLDDKLNTGRSYSVENGKLKVRVGAKWGALLVGK